MALPIFLAAHNCGGLVVPTGHEDTGQTSQAISQTAAVTTLADAATPAAGATPADPVPCAAWANAVIANTGNMTVNAGTLIDSYQPAVGPYGGANVGSAASVEVATKLTNNGGIVHALVTQNSPAGLSVIPVPAGATNLPLGSSSPGSLNINAASADVTLSPGDYVAANITVGSPGAISVSPQGKVRIWVTGNLNLGGNENVGENPRNLAFLVTSSGQINVNGSGALYGLIDAPTSGINLDSTVFGAVIGSTVTLNSGAAVHFPQGRFANALPAIGTSVAYAELGITLGTGDQTIGGDVGVAVAGASTLGPQIAVGNQDCLDLAQTVYSPTVSLGSKAIVGDIDTNALTNDGGQFALQAPYPASAMPLLPLAPVVSSGGASITVAAGQQQQLTPGTFGALIDNGILLLAPGAYSFASVVLGNNAQIQASQGGLTTIQVAGTVSTGTQAQIFPIGQQAGALSVSVVTSDGPTAPAVSIGSNNLITALVSAPHGTVSIGAKTSILGAVLGFNITASNNVTLQFQSGFPPAPASTGTPVAGYTLPPSAPIIGPVPTDAQIGLAVDLPVNDNAGLQTFIQQVTDPTNVMYRSYMSISTFAALHGDSPTEYAKVAPWAASFGLTATTYANNLLVDVQGTAAQIEQALGANLVLALRSDGTVFYEADRLPTPSLPTAFDAIQLMDTFANPQPVQTVPSPGGGQLFGSSDLRTAYLGVGSTCSTLTGVGQSIGIVAFDAFTQPGTIGPDGGPEGSDDISTYERLTNITGCQTNGGALPCTPYPILRTVNAPPVYPPNGTNPGPAQPSGTTGSSEAALDVEMAIAMAPGAQIVNVEGQSIDSILSALATTPNLNQISDSWLARSNTSQRFLDEFAAQGQSFFQGSGDAGEYVQTAAACSCPCTTPGTGAATTETLFTCSGTECQSVCGPLPDGGVDAASSPPALVCVANYAPPLDGQLVDMRASQEITLVGGTVLTTCGSSSSGTCAGPAAFTQAYSSETGWPFGGGGLIPGTKLPDFQQPVSTLLSTAGRNSPDVSMVATGLFIVSTGCGPAPVSDAGTPEGGAPPATNLVNGTCPAAQLLPGQPGGASGTSAAAPLWAGFMALINQQGASQTPPLASVGYPNEAFYGLLASGAYTQAFHDIQGGPPNTSKCGLGSAPAPGWDSVTGLGTPNGCGMIAAMDELASPPQATIVLDDIEFNGTGFNVCTACSSNCTVNVPNTTIVCNPNVSPDGGVTSGTVAQEVACNTNNGGHGAFVTVTCAPTTTPPVDAGNGAPTRGLDVTVTLSLENNCGDNTALDSQSATAIDVLPAEPQQILPDPACDFFGGNCSPIIANGGACTFNGFVASATVSNTGGFFRHP